MQTVLYECKFKYIHAPVDIHVACTQFTDCVCPIQTSYTQMGSSSGYPAIEGGPVCEQYGTQDVGSTCEARTLCENDASCRGFFFTRDPTFTPEQPKVSL